MTDTVISVETIKILKNFSTINQSIIVHPGNIIRTLSNNNIIMGTAKVTENFESQWAIYDMPQFLSAFELFDEPVLEFKDNSVLIKEKGQKKGIDYRFADVSIIHSTNQDITMPKTEVNFTLSAIDLARFLKTSAVLQAPHFVVTNSDIPGNVKILVDDLDNPSSNVYSIDHIADDVVNEPFKFVFNIENIKVYPGEYNIGISSKFLSHWMMNDLNYFIAPETSSTFGS